MDNSERELEKINMIQMYYLKMLPFMHMINVLIVKKTLIYMIKAKNLKKFPMMNFG